MTTLATSPSSDESGTSAIEYGLMAALVSVTASGALAG